MAVSPRRLVQLWLLYARLDLVMVLRGPTTALSFYISDMIIALATVTGLFLLAERFDGLGVWSRDQVVFLLGYALVVRGTINILFNYNLALISRRIGRGQLDHVLIQPQPMWAALITEGFAPATGAGMLLPGIAITVWSIGALHLQVDAIWVALLVLYVVSSVAIVLAFEFAWGSLAFWAPRAAEELNGSTWRLLMELNGFPLDGLTGIALGALLTFIPVGLVAWLPARALLGIEAQPWTWLVPPLAAAIFLSLATLIFQRGLRHYGHTGSSRYLPYGHRR